MILKRKEIIRAATIITAAAALYRATVLCFAHVASFNPYSCPLRRRHHYPHVAAHWTSERDDLSGAHSWRDRARIQTGSLTPSSSCSIISLPGQQMLH